MARDIIQPPKGSKSQALKRLVQLSENVLITISCEWSQCDAILNSGTAWLQHQLFVHCPEARTSQNDYYLCALKSCNSSLQSDLEALKEHVRESHFSRLPLPCPVQDCSVRLSKKRLFQHFQDPEHEDIHDIIWQSRSTNREFAIWKDSAQIQRFPLEPLLPLPRGPVLLPSVPIMIPRRFRRSVEPMPAPTPTPSYQEASQGHATKQKLVETGLAKGIVGEESDKTPESESLPLNDLVHQSILFGGDVHLERVYLQVQPRDPGPYEAVSRPPIRPPGATWKPLPVTIFYHAMQEQLLLAESESEL